jgi:hypothetical protein
MPPRAARKHNYRARLVTLTGEPLARGSEVGRRQAPGFWQRLLGRLASPSKPGSRPALGFRLKLVGDDGAVGDSPFSAPADPDTEPSNWSHPHFWAAFAIHGIADHSEAGTVA